MGQTNMWPQAVAKVLCTIYPIHFSLLVNNHKLITVKKFLIIHGDFYSYGTQGFMKKQIYPTA